MKINLQRDYCYDTKCSITEEKGEDEKGKYTIKETIKEVYCNCHPETCVHFNGKTTVTKKEKIYDESDNEIKG